MSSDWATLLAGGVGALLGAGGAVATTVLTTRSDRAARQADREADRQDRDDEESRKRADRLAEQGRSAAREALAITSQFFVPSGDRALWNPMSWADKTDVRKIDDLAELIESEDARRGIRDTVAAIHGIDVVAAAATGTKLGQASQTEVWLREQQLLALLRRILGSYLREEAHNLANYRSEAEDALREVHTAQDQLRRTSEPS
jgi:hypothetical protein